ncbi:MAG: hypothetical protein K6U04_02735 [Armatimonadetes bacterium]|nr:hypothetical protein [Armatimonadota bacterium]
MSFFSLIRAGPAGEQKTGAARTGQHILPAVYQIIHLLILLNSGPGFFILS